MNSLPRLPGSPNKHLEEFWVGGTKKNYFFPFQNQLNSFLTSNWNIASNWISKVSLILN